MIERYTRPEMARIWTLENRYRSWLRVELAVCAAWNRLGVIDDANLAAIRERADVSVDRILEIEEVTRHDVIAFLTALEESGAGGAFHSPWLHVFGHCGHGRFAPTGGSGGTYPPGL